MCTLRKLNWRWWRAEADLFRVAPRFSFAVCALLVAGAFIYSARVHARTEQATMCLAENLYHEARGEDSSSQRLIGTITLARLMDALAQKRTPATVCGIVGQDRQFSWTLDHRLATSRTEQAKWAQAVALSRELIAQAASGELTLPSGWECVRFYKRTDGKGVSNAGKRFFDKNLSAAGQFGHHTAYRSRLKCPTPFPTA